MACDEARQSWACARRLALRPAIARHQPASRYTDRAIVQNDSDQFGKSLRWKFNVRIDESDGWGLTALEEEVRGNWEAEVASRFGDIDWISQAFDTGTNNGKRIVSGSVINDAHVCRRVVIQ